MSVIMTMRIPGDPARLEQVAAANADRLTGITDIAKRHGVIAHRFYGSENEIMVIDEWPAPENFQSFFGEAGEQIQSVMQEVGVQGEPAITFWRKLDSRDEIGWEG